MKKWLVAAGFTSLIVAVGVVTLVLTGENVAVGASKVYEGGDVSVEIRSLKGRYEIDTYSIESERNISIPYTSSIEQGNVTLEIRRDGEEFFSTSLPQNDESELKLHMGEGAYTFSLETEQAEEIELTLKLSGQ
ncbi:hypothetical protein ACQ4XT_14465 [Halobacillus faecis]